MVSAAGKFGPYNQAGPFPAFPGAGPQTGADLVRSRIALHLRLGALRPGERLPDTGHLAEQLGIGEMTARRALEGMCQDGLLDRRRGRTGGTFVSADWYAVVPACHDPAAAAAVAAFLLLLECGLVAHASGEVGAEQLKGLRDLVARIGEADADRDALPELETRFHLDLAETLGGPAVRAVAADLLGRLSLLRPLPDAAAVLRRNPCHERLLTQLAAGRTDRAIGAVKGLHATTSGPAPQAGPDVAGTTGP
ncbi:GntR family transcriptional regulator [Streptacidiphilus pinicola]|uniref:GntR family transcriptional regulator n=1 Tax=Streptacidiphilus pinicola TaxID=2219663 RepID=A0A2X0KGI6_9ACTN|nr:GntR family transcriptional regulator [Streptacidiphilus pinicola]RAG85960.1 GntR family transcriptional regulator [Streptacidiphilus pinicola]